MKMADLVIGQDYLVSSAPNWQKVNGWGVTRVTVLGLRYQVERYFGANREAKTLTVGGETYLIPPTHTRDPKARHVLVAKHRADGSKVIGLVVPGHVRMTWAEGEAELARHKEQADKDHAERIARTKAHQAKNLQIKRDLADLWPEDLHGLDLPEWGDITRVVNVPTPDLLEILRRLKGLS